MDGLHRSQRKSLLVLGTLLGGIALTSCGNAPQETGISAPASAPASITEVSQEASTAKDTQTQAQARTQLIKKASLTVLVESLDKSIDTVSQIIDKQQGDLIGLDEQPTGEDARPTASIQMRVPQHLLETTLEELAKLGTVQSRRITAEDVGSQIVDIKARLTNLRKTEVNLQKIMDRAGSVKDILSVSQELSNVRQQIEQIDAQLKSLQNQVAYSTITLKLEATVPNTNQQRAFGSQIQETWNSSTKSLGEFTTGLLKLGIWLMVYSPYWLIILAGAYGLNRLLHVNSRSQTQRPNDPNS